MASEKLGPTPEALAQSPIHNFIGMFGIESPQDRKVFSTQQLLFDVAGKIQAPALFQQRLQNPLDEILIERGKYGALNMTDDQAKEFAQKARAITEKYELKGQEGQILLKIFSSVVALWARHNQIQLN